MAFLTRISRLFKGPVEPFRFQWHVTARCNLACRHCYGDGDRFEPGYPELEKTWERICAFIRHRERELGRPVQAHIVLTGGEPFLREDFFDLLGMVGGGGAVVSILTNGTLIDRCIARRLARHKPAYVQVSLEGPPTVHDRIRGAGSCSLARKGIQNLVSAGVKVILSFTAHKENYGSFERVAELGCELGVARVWADRQVPLGTGREFDMLTPAQTRQFFEIMGRAKEWAVSKGYSTDIAMHRSLQFLVSGTVPYACNAGRNLLTLLPDGSLVPCRRMPVILGNVLHTPISRIYHTSPFLCRLRDPDLVPGGCGDCAHLKGCRGGARCLSFAAYRDPFRADPGCWLAKA